MDARCELGAERVGLLCVGGRSNGDAPSDGGDVSSVVAPCRYGVSAAKEVATEEKRCCEISSDGGEEAGSLREKMGEK